MFYEGSLQSGIALAIREKKLVACFVRDDGATSNEWESDWLTSAWLSSLLARKAVLLRLQAGSTEAGFLAAFCDTTTVPTFVVIENGKLSVQLNGTVSKEEFINIVREVLGASAIPGSRTTQTIPQQASTPEPTSPPIVEETGDDLYGVEENVYGPPEPSVPAIPSVPAPPPVAAPSAKANGKQKATSASEAKPASSLSSSTSATQQAARDALRKKKREDAEELARIKGRIEADKAERRAQAEVRRIERERERNTLAQAQPQSRTTTSSKGSQAKSVNLNVRLFDGRTIRSIFPRTATLQDDVRSWVDQEFAKLGADDPNINNTKLPPYFFKHILSPQPSHELSAGDESQSLGDIDLAPSATLVLVPVKGYTEAYSGATGGVVGAATGLVGGAFGLLSSTVGYVGSTLGSVIGYSAAPPESQNTAQTSSSRTEQADQQLPVSDPSSIRVRTLADQRASEPQQFYNGNQLDFEPRNDDDDKRQ